MFESSLAVLEGFPAGIPGGLLVIIITGFFTGILASAMGVGGGFIFTPFFHGIAGLGGVQAVATSMGQIPITSLSAVWRYYKNKKIKYSHAFLLLAGAIPVSQATAWFLGNIKNTSWGSEVIYSGMTLADVMITALFSLMLTFLGLYGLMKVRRKEKKTSDHTPPPKQNRALGLLIGGAIGFLSAFLGVGGGFIAVPYFIHRASLSPAEAAATSHFCIVPLTAITALHYWLQGSLLIWLSLTAAAGGVLGAQIGAHFSIKTAPAKLEKMFAMMQLVIAFVYLTVKLTNTV